jgi:Domain of unknown function (DUF4349)
MPVSCTHTHEHPQPRRERRARRRTRFFALLAALVVVLAACGGDDSDGSATGDFDQGGSDNAADDGAAMAEPPDDELLAQDTVDRDDAGDSGDDVADSLDASADSTGEEGTVGEPESTPPSGGADLTVPAVISALAAGRQIISTGDVVIESADVQKATADVIEVVFANGGAIWGQDTRTDPSPQTVLTIRVPPGDFDRVFKAISGLQGATLVSQSVTTDDVTETVVDLDARITAAESSVGRVQVLLDAARDLNTVFTLEEELAARQAQLERLRGQRKTIGDQIALATITLTIVELDPDRLTPEMEVVAWLGTDVEDACPGVSDLSIGADDTAVLCVNVSNTGDDTLTDIEIASSTFRLRVDDFLVNQSGTGTLEALEPGEDLLVYAELDAEGGFIRRVDASRGINIDVTVATTPEMSPTVELTAADSVFISADVDDPLPGFSDSFSSGWSAMIAVVSVLMIAVGVLLPFLPFLLVAAWLIRRSVVRNRRRADAEAAYLAAGAVPAPPAQPVPAPASQPSAPAPSPAPPAGDD